MEQITATDRTAHKLRSVLADFKINGEITAIHKGPIVTVFEFEPIKGIRTAKIIGLADDIARCMAVGSARVSLVSNSSAVGIELPNSVREIVSLTELFDTDMWQHHHGALPIILGKDMFGSPVISDLAKMPHLLVAGTTGSGKSVGIHSIICSLLQRFTSEQVRLILIDPKMLEMTQYNDIPHLLTPVITDPNKAIAALKWVLIEMERRYKLMRKINSRNIGEYNQHIIAMQSSGEVITEYVKTGYDDNGDPEYEYVDVILAALPYIVIVIDEVADLMIQAGKEMELAMQRISQMARASGIHLIMATQRPSVNVITGTIKANFPTRISYRVQSKIDSRTILGEQGAERLLGNGDLLMLEGSKLQRIQGAYIDDAGIQELVDHHSAGLKPYYTDIITHADELS